MKIWANLFSTFRICPRLRQSTNSIGKFWSTWLISWRRLHKFKKNLFLESAIFPFFTSCDECFITCTSKMRSQLLSNFSALKMTTNFLSTPLSTIRNTLMTSSPLSKSTFQHKLSQNTTSEWLVHFLKPSNLKSLTATSSNCPKQKNKWSDTWTKTVPLCAPFWSRSMYPLK